MALLARLATTWWTWVRIAAYRGTVGVQLGMHGDIRWRLRQDLVDHLAHHALDVHRHTFSHRAATEGEHTVDECAPALAGDHDVVEVAREPASLRARRAWPSRRIREPRPRMLLKSCAMPPARVPIASRRCARRHLRSIDFNSSSARLRS
jgi:hypothetical protein